MPALLVTLPTEALPAASSVMLPVAEPDVDVKVLPAVKVAAPPLTTKDETVSPVPAVVTKAVLALAEVMATAPVTDCAFTFAFKLVSKPVLRLPEDLSSTPETPETVPVVKVPVLVVSKFTMPALLVTLPTEALPAALSVMLPVAVPVVDENVEPAVKSALPPLTA